MMEQELDLSYKNLQIQKKYLSNLKSLHRYKAYQNVGMEFNINKVGKIVKRIEEGRFNVSNYDIIFEFANLIERLDLTKETFDFESIHDWIDHSTFIKMFGADAAGPEMKTECFRYNGIQSMKHYKIYYDDNCTELSRKPYERD